jgi:hypothetical protein
MPSPLVKLMTYGGTPINRQADRFLTHKSRKRHKKKKKRIQTTPKGQKRFPKVRLQSPGLQPCPYCGKLKVGLQAHISAKHRNVDRAAVPHLKPEIADSALSAPAPPKLGTVTSAPPAVPQPRLDPWEGIHFGKSEPPAWATKPATAPKPKSRKPAPAGPARIAKPRPSSRSKARSES